MIDKYRAVKHEFSTSGKPSNSQYDRMIKLKIDRDRLRGALYWLLDSKLKGKRKKLHPAWSPGKEVV